VIHSRSTLTILAHFTGRAIGGGSSAAAVAKLQFATRKALLKPCFLDFHPEYHDGAGRHTRTKNTIVILSRAAAKDLGFLHPGPFAALLRRQRLKRPQGRKRERCPLRASCLRPLRGFVLRMFRASALRPRTVARPAQARTSSAQTRSAHSWPATSGGFRKIINEGGNHCRC
jgi:hypothetical protein